MTKRPKILVVEDQMLIAFELVDLLERHGYEVTGPFNTVRDAQLAIQDHDPDAAILDINLGQGETSEPIADMLMESKRPFAFLSGYRSSGALSPRFKGVELLRKPARPRRIVALVETLTANVD